MTKNTEIAEVVYDCLLRISNVPREELSLDLRLGEPGLGLDSIACLELLLSVEASTGLRLRSEELTGDVFETVRSLIGYVATLSND